MGHPQTCPVLFGSVRFCSEVFGFVRKCSVLFGSVRFCSEVFGFVRKCPPALSPSPPLPLVSRSPRLPVSSSLGLLVSRTPCLLVSLSPRLPQPARSATMFRTRWPLGAISK